jgi:hypothetical protein
MGQVHLEPVVLQSIHRPVPPIGCLDRDRRARTRLTDLAQQRDAVIVDPDRLEDLTRSAHPADHAALAMQIDPNQLARGKVSNHGGLPSRGQ